MRISQKGHCLKIIVFTFFFFSYLSFAANSSLSLLGTYKNVKRVNGKFVTIPSYHKLPKRWEKNDQYYGFVILHDPKKVASTKELSVQVEFLKKRKVLESLKLPKKNFKKVGDKFFIHSFSEVIPSKYPTPYTVRYTVLSGKEKLVHEIEVMEGD